MNAALAEKAALFAAKRRALGIVACALGRAYTRVPVATPSRVLPPHPAIVREPPRIDVLPSHKPSARPSVDIAPSTVTARETWKTIKGATELDLISRFQAGDRRAGDRLLAAHEGFVQSQTRGWIRIYPSASEDLLQESRLGLSHAIMTFDPAEGVSLLTYAAYWIRHNVQRFIDNHSSDIRIPANLRAKLRRARRAGTELTGECEVAAMAANRRPTSLDAPLDDSDGDRTFGDVVSTDERLPDDLVLDALDSVTWREALAKMSFVLTGKEREAIANRFCDEPLTLEAIAEKSGVTREAIRVRERSALAKLRTQARRAGYKFDDLWSPNR